MAFNSKPYYPKQRFSGRFDIYYRTFLFKYMLKKEILTINTVQDLVAHYSDNAELGAKIREIYGEKQADGDRAED